MNDNRVIDIAIIGAGASGLMLGSLLRDKDVVIFDGNAKAGAKLLVSGGGKCNITNEWVEPIHYVGNPHFINEILRQFDQHSLLEWIRERGLEPIERGNRQYFCPKSSSQILDIFKRENSDNLLYLNQKVLDITKKNLLFQIETTSKTYQAQKLIIATGGLSFSILGADDIGYRVAERFGHTIIPTAPALVGLTLQKEQFFFKQLSGISTEVEIKVGEQSCLGSLLFTHRGISGPAVLDASLYWQKGQIEIDFTPGWNLEDHYRSQKSISSLLPLPKRLSKAFLEHYDIPDLPTHKLRVVDREKIVGLRRYRFSPAGTFGYGKAEVTRGGVKVDEIDSRSMMSRKCKDLYFVGEVMDVTGRLGGYNLQWAFSTAYVCASSLQKS
ncbi:NAD(FAD)-utilizing dehydrogenases [hydrothermal vent metagenome]|uniref:NAD(FAD)-utilizing dehydrogenases n=1 Tax=hydrothermal vent metagenome TaxID=652676 RepID=A0A1W1CB94_9ZZZZ